MSVALRRGDQARGRSEAGLNGGSAPAVNGETGRFRLFTEGDELYAAMLSAIRAARRSIRLETFIFAGDEIGWQFAKSLSAKARAGVDVRFHFDARGAKTGASPDLYREMLAADVKLKWYHAWNWRHPTRYFQRNHRKLLVVDEEVLFLGGANICLLNSHALHGDGRQRDTHVAVSGALACQAAALFDWMWDHTDVAHRDARAVKVPALNPSIAPSTARLYHRKIARLYVLLIGRAVRSVYLTSPYFCPGSVVEAALLRAARRGVDVRLLVPRNSDPPFVGWMTRFAYSSLMKAGARVYEYLPPRKLHAKSIAIDGDWSIIGSVNLDHWSLVTNHELVLVARDQRLGNELRDQFFQDLENSAEVQPSDWAERGWRERLLETVGWMARKLL